jgi:hypothetical protein
MKSGPQSLHNKHRATLPRKSQTPKTTTTVASAQNNLARVLPNASLLAGTVFKTVLFHWKQQESVGDRVLPFTYYYYGFASSLLA